MTAARQLGFAVGWLRGRWVSLFVLAGALWFFIAIAPFLWLIVRGLAFLIPLWILGFLTRGITRPARRPSDH